MNTPTPDDERLPGEDELAALYRKLPRSEPGPELDMAVRRVAAQAVRPARRPARWPVALGTAATLVVAGLLGWQLHEFPASKPSASKMQAPNPPSTAVSAPAPAFAPAPREESAKTVRPAQQAYSAAPAATPTAEGRAAHPTAMARTLYKRKVPAMDDASGAPAPAIAPAAPAPIATSAPSNATNFRALALPRQRVAPQANRQAPVAAITAPNTASPAKEMAEDIQHLLDTHDYDAAREQIQRYRKTYPDQPIPDNWRPFLSDQP